jgi:hypothetical protein
MNLPVTVGMQEYPIVCRITATMGPPDDVMVVPSRQLGNLLGSYPLLVMRVQHSRLCRKVAFWRQNPKMGSRKFNDLGASTFLFSVICDRAAGRALA